MLRAVGRRKLARKLAFRRRQFGLLAALAACAALPASASACPSLSRVKSFAGTASLSFSRTVTASDGQGGTETISLDHGASNLQLSITLVSQGLRPPIWEGPSTGGSVTVHDTYSDNNGANTATGTQDGSGPSAAGDAAGLSFDHAHCTYSVTAAAAIATTTTGSGPRDPYGIHDFAITSGAIPSNFHLSGSAQVPAYADPLDSTPTFTGDSGQYVIGDHSNWGIALARLTGNEDNSVGQATFSWDLAPTFYPKACYVPPLKGFSLARARKLLRHDFCRVGRILRRRSSRVRPGRVIASKPRHYTTHPRGHRVTLIVSSGAG